MLANSKENDLLMAMRPFFFVKLNFLRKETDDNTILVPKPGTQSADDSCQIKY